MRKFFLSAALAAFFCLAAGSAWGQVSAAPPTDPLAEKDALHLNTIGAFSAGFVLQSYGYIGVLADVLSQEVYPSAMVRDMLAETINYLRNVNAQLLKYHSGPPLASGDLEFISAIMEIINHLISEADSLSSFAQTKSKEDLRRYEEARRNAWKSIRRTFNIK